MNPLRKQQLRLLWKENYHLAVASVIIGFLCAIMGDSLKKVTEYYEDKFLTVAQGNSLLYVVLPLFGFIIIYFLRQQLFKKKENKGIREIFDTVNTRQNELPLYKIPSHYINGVLTVAFGGSTGIEVSTVVASATIGSASQKRISQRKKYKTELICAGIAAGITALFSSPIAGVLFAFEVISRKVSKRFIISTGIAVLTAWTFNLLMSEEPLFKVDALHWNLYALPYFVLLGIVAGLNSVYLTRCVLFFKKKAQKLQSHSLRILIGSAVLGISLLCFPQLYGEGYHAVKHYYYGAGEIIVGSSLLLSLLAIILLKPVVTAVTLASGGDGGVFAPSLFIGAFLGLVTATVLNRFFGADVVVLNFMIIGMASMLSASIHAPFTAVFLVCGLIGNYTLIVPVLIGCLIAKVTSKLVYPYTVYSAPK